jgi:competence protein ComEC
MFKLQTGYLISGVITGIMLLFSFLTSLPDGKLHVVFCNVGQGDAAYVKFPDGKDLLVDGGPGNGVLTCLGQHMPFWDRSIDMVALSHPEKDHLDGLISVLERYQVKYLFRSDVSKDTAGYSRMIDLVKTKKISQKLLSTGQNIRIGSATLSVLWPTQTQLALMKPLISSNSQSPTTIINDSAQILGASTGNVNDGSLVLKLSFGNFDVLFPGDADSHVDEDLTGRIPFDADNLEILKVPHHGSKTGMSDRILSTLSPPASIRQKCLFQTSQNSPNPLNVNPQLSGSATVQKIRPDCPLAVISVGKNSYGHPAEETIERLQKAGFNVVRTDQAGDIEIIANGKTWYQKN